MIKKSFIIFSVLILILSLFFVSAHREDVQDEKFYLDKWLDNLWGKITGNPIFQRGGKQTPSLAPIENNQNRNLFSRGQSPQIQNSPTTLPDKEISLEITKKSEEIKKLTSNLLELNTQYKEISSVKSTKKKSMLSELDKLAIERKNKMTNLAKENPILFLNNVLSEKERNLFPDEIKEHIEEKTIIEGKLLTLHIDDFSNRNNPISKFEYFIITKENKKINFYPLVSLGFIPESKIKVSGYKIDKNIVGFVKEIETKEEKTSKTITGKAIQYPSPIIPPVPEEHKIAVILVNFLDSPPSPFTPAEANDLIFNGQFQNFYQEQSYNKIYFTGDVFGWFTLPRNSQGNCRITLGNGGELDPYITDNNINLNNYDHLLVIGGGCVYGPSDYGVAFSSLGSFPLTIENQTYNVSVAAIFGDNDLFSTTNMNALSIHEIGHSLGVLHANGYDCGEQSYFDNNYTNCKHMEYGNLFDLMGSGRYALHFNGFYKELLGWISPQDSLSITKSGTYTINAIEESEGKKFAKIKMLDSSAFDVSNLEKSIKTPYYPYYLEYRRGIGFDDTLNNPDLISNQDGILINSVLRNSYDPRYYFSRLLDMDASLLDWNEDLKSASLSGNNIFYDPLTGITIGPIISSTSTNITFNVSLQKTNCIREYPLIHDIKLISYDPNHISAGNNIIFFLTNFNPDYPICGPSEFNAIAELPLGFSSGDFPLKMGLFPLGEANFVAGVETSQNLCSRSYPISFSVENLNSGLITTETIYVNITGTTLCSQEALPEF